MKRRVIIFLAAAMAFVGITLAQTVRNEADRSGDPWWRPFNPQGQSYGVSYGFTRPVRSQELHDGELFVDMDAGASSGPRLEIYDGTNAEWDVVGTDFSGLTDNTIPVFDSATVNLIDSGIVDDATTITLTRTTFTTALTTFNATATTVDFTTAGLALTAAGVLTADADFDIQAVGLTHISADGSSTADALAFGTSQTADAQIYFGGTALIIDLDGTDSNDLLIELGGGDSEFRVRSTTGASLVRYDPVNTANNGLTLFELEVGGVAATNGSDLIDLLLIDWNETDWATDVETLTAINLDSITQDAQGTYVGLYIGANWDDVLVFEGATPDTEELIIRVVDPTADIIAQFRNDAAGTYNIIMHDNANLTESQLMFPNAAGLANGTAEGTDALAADTTVVCYRFFNPTPMTVSEVQVISQDATSPAGSDLFGFALYEDASAGAQLCEGTGAYAADNTAVTVACAATLEADWYRLCGGQSDVSAAIWSSIAPGAAQLLLNNDAVATEGLWTIAANSHSAADMPATTGALSATTEAMPILKLQSN